MDDLNKTGLNAIRIIFFIQIGLLSMIGLLFIVGYTQNRFSVGAFFFAILLGGLGASISLMRRLYNKGGLLKDQPGNLKYFSVLMPILYGTLMSGVAYLLFLSGILSGDGGNGLLTTNLFPNFRDTTFYNDDILEQFVLTKPASIKDAGKLLVWCFLSGYSERFVTGILAQLDNHSAKLS